MIVLREQRGSFRGMLLGGMLTVAFACSGEAAATPWDELVAAAKAEGKVEVILSGQVPQLLRKAMPDFEKKYGIRVNFQTGAGAQHARRILAERRIGRFTVDVWMGGVNPPLTQFYPTGALDPIDDLLIEPTVKDPALWYKGTHHYADPEGRYILSWGASPSHVISYNTKLVNPDEIKSYADLLEPKWRGKIVTWSPAQPGATGSSIPMFLNPKIGEDWFRRWSKMDLTIVEDARQGAEWIALGRFPIGMFGLGTQIREMADQGFPVREYLPHSLAEGDALSPSAANIMVMSNAPNPNARQLFVNWALSKEAHIAFIAISERTDSLRLDVPNEALEPQYRIDRSRDYFSPSSRARPEYADHVRQQEVLKTLRGIMSDAGIR